MKYLILLVFMIGTLSAESLDLKPFLKNGLPIKKGKGIKIWDQAIELAVNKNNVEAMDAIIRVSRSGKLEGFYLSTYKYDLFNTFKSNPELFLNRASMFYKDEGTCAAYWLVPGTGETKKEQVLSILRKNTSDKFKKFSSMVHEIEKITKNDPIKLTKCWKMQVEKL